VVLTISVVIGNVLLFGWAIFKFIRQKLYERKAQKIKDNAAKRRSRMDSIDVTSFSNPSLDATKIAKSTTCKMNTKDDGDGIELTAGNNNPMCKLRLKKKKTLSKKKKEKKEKKEKKVSHDSLVSASEVKIEIEDKIEIDTDSNVITEHNDGATGRRYSYNSTTEETKWLDDANDVTVNTNQQEVIKEEEGEVELGIETNEHGRRYSWHPITGETAWLDDEDAIEVLADGNGRRYSYNKHTEVSTWLDDN
jgi:hypothetical protein